MARVLLVDDEDCILRTTSILLESEGYSTVSVLNGKEAQAQLETSDFDLMVTDIRMAPVDGMELIKFARLRKPGMPIIVISAYCSDKTAQEAIDLGAFRYIKKPFRLEVLLSGIREAIGSTGKA